MTVYNDIDCKAKMTALVIEYMWHTKQYIKKEKRAEICIADRVPYSH